MEKEQNDINFDEVVEAVKASLKDNNNMNSEVEEFVTREQEIINNTITFLKTQEDIPSSHNKKTLDEILQILNSDKYTSDLSKENNITNINNSNGI